MRPYLPEVQDRVLVGDRIDLMNGLPAGSVDMVFADPPDNRQLAGELLRPDNSKVDAVDDDWEKFADFARTIPRPALAEGARYVPETRGTLWVIGSYGTLPHRHGAAGPGRLATERHRVAKVEPDAELQGKRFTNAHETLIWAARDGDQARTPSTTMR